MSNFIVTNNIQIYTHDDVYWNDGFTFTQQPTTSSRDILLVVDIKMGRLENYYHTLLDIYPCLNLNINEKCYVCFRDVRNAKKIIKKHFISKHVFLFLADVFPLYEIVDDNDLSSIKYLKIWHIKNKKHHSYIHSDLAFFKNLLINKKEPDNFTVPNFAVIRRTNTRFLDVNIREYLIKKLGYVEIIMEDYTPSQQAKIFNKAQIIIATHGAGLVNMVYASKNTKIIELSTGFNVRCFSNMKRFNRDFIETNFIQIYPDNYIPIPQHLDPPLKNLNFTKNLRSFKQEYHSFVDKL